MLLVLRVKFYVISVQSLLVSPKLWVGNCRILTGGLVVPQIATPQQGNEIKRIHRRGGWLARLHHREGSLPEAGLLYIG